jgi:hypothetical protein
VNPKLIMLIVAGAGGAAALVSLLRSKKKTPEDFERERRARIQEIGRITDGTVIDTQEIEGDENGYGQAQLLIYTYDVGGVTYEASQDITTLRQWVDLHQCRIGLPASIKYDPKSPGNSIVICESWSGLRMKRNPASIAPSGGRRVEAERQG